VNIGTDKNYALIARKTYPDNKLEMFSVDLNKARNKPTSEWNPVIHPEDTIYLFNSQADRAQLIKSHIKQLKSETAYGSMAPVVSISGKIDHQGDYPLEPGMRISQLLKAAGGLNESSYGMGAE